MSDQQLQLINDLVFLSHYLGSRIDLVQGKGGNFSAKIDQDIIIKGSGFAFKQITLKNGLTRINNYHLKCSTDHLNRLSEETYGKWLDSLSDMGLRPSLETPLHTIFKKKIVIHIHPVYALSIISSSSGEAIINKLFPNARWVPYATPGVKLMRAFTQVYTSECDIYFLENHGIVIGSDDVKKSIERIEYVNDLCTSYFDITPDKKCSTLIELIYHLTATHLIAHKEKNDQLAKLFQNLNETYYPICPDDVVCIGRDILIVKESIPEKLTLHYNRNGKTPKVIWDGDDFIFINSSTDECIHTAQQLFANLTAVSLNKECKEIDQFEQSLLESWEAETFRTKIEDGQCK